MPQLFAMMSDFENKETFYDGDTDLCAMLSYSVNKSRINIQSNNTNDTCSSVSIILLKSSDLLEKSKLILTESPMMLIFNKTLMQ